jgi:hypothetical protein
MKNSNDYRLNLLTMVYLKNQSESDVHYLIPSLVSKAVPFSASFAPQNLLLRTIINEYVAKYYN